MVNKNYQKNDEENSTNVNYRLCTLDEVPEWIKCQVNFCFILLRIKLKILFVSPQYRKKTKNMEEEHEQENKSITVTI